LTRSQARRIAIAALIAFVGLSGTTALGFWQYSRAHRDDISKRVLAATAAPVRALVPPESYVPESVFGHRVAMPARIEGGRTLATCDREQAGQPSGCWLIAPAFFGDDTHAVTVLLGLIPESRLVSGLAQVRAKGSTDVTLLGRLQPAEVIDRGSAFLRPSDTVASINVNELAMRWNTDLLDGYVVLARPYFGRAVTAPLILPPSGITWRNLLYAWQWWTFAAFVLFLLARFIIDVRNEAPTISGIDGATGAAREDLP